MKNLKKIAIILMLIVLCFSIFNVNVYAATAPAPAPNNPPEETNQEDNDSEADTSPADASWKNVKQFDNKNDTTLDEKAKTIVGAILSVIRIVAVGVAIIMLLFVAMKYMTSAPGDRADIKKHAVVYVVGAIVLFGSAGILQILQDFAGNI